MATSITDKNKRLLGRFIKIRRLENDLTQIQLITDDRGNQICSLSTLYRLESGGLVKDDTVYHALIAQFHEHFVENTKFDQAIPHYNQQLMHYFETLDQSEAEHFLTEIRLLLKIKDFYYQRLAQCYLDMIEVNRNRKKLSEAEYRRYRLMIDFMPEPLNVLLLHLCFCHANNYHHDLSELLSYEAEMKKYQEYLIIKMDFLLLLSSSRKVLDYLTLSSEVIEYTKLKGLINQQGKALVSLINVVAVVQPSTLPVILKDLLKLIAEQEKQFNPSILNNIQYSLAMMSYADLKDYGKAVELFEMLLKKEPIKIYACGPYYCTACEMLGSRPLESILKEIKWEQANIYLRYFYFKYIKMWPISELIHYLKTDVAEDLKLSKSPLKLTTFKQQWNILLKQSPKKYYKDFYEFMSNFE